MPCLRLTQSAHGDSHKVHVSFEGTGVARQTADVAFSFALSADDEGDLRWYLEDYLEWPQEPAPTIAARVEKRMEEIGAQLFRAIFQSNDDARELWSALRLKLAKTRVEVVTGVNEAASIPWELLRDPRTGAALALRCREFVRAQPDAVQAPNLPTASGAIRILLVICRPAGGKDVPFRSVAARLLKSLGAAAREAFDLEVLRPPTFEALAEALRDAHAADRPYHVLHFDGHGAHTDLEPLFEAWATSECEGRARLAEALRIDVQRFSPQALYPHTPRSGAHGYLVFESATSANNQRYVDGQELGRLLVETGVPVLVLNACRSAHAEIRDQPKTADDADAHEQRRAFGSLAQEIMDAGVAGVVAMRYNVYVVTAAQFIADLYASLVRGRSLGHAVTLGRKQLNAKPLRTLAFDPLPLQDWTVPIVYEAAPIALFPEPKETDSETTLEISLEEGSIASSQGVDAALPPSPDAGFYGRDETLLALDRAFDTQTVVLLHAYAGSGKTATAAEFARWYALTGGVRGPVLFTSFEHYTPLVRVLDQVGEAFGPLLERSGIHWLAITDEATRRKVALQVLAQIPALWIWDNVEPVTGFPTGTESAWSEAEQSELVRFLRDARNTKAKFLLTSRRDETVWLGDLPSPIQVPPMPMAERLQLARALAEKRGRLAEVMKHWLPLLKFSGGNPLALTVLVGQALRDGLAGAEAVRTFVDRLRSGEAAFDDEGGEARSRSLAASLGYGFEHAFDEEERRRLALLHLFQGFVDANAIVWMGKPEVPWFLPEVRGLSRDDAIALLDRAAEVGLLTRHGGGFYGIHPALPWFFRGLFELYYGTSKEAARRAFAEAMGLLGNFYHDQYVDGNRDVIGALRFEEANLLRARRLAQTHGWWVSVTNAMQGLQQLYWHNGRRAEWRRLVEEIVPDFVDPDTEGPLPGREEDWGLLAQYRVHLAKEERQWDEAERLQSVCVERDRQRAARVLNLSRASLDGSQRNTIRTLACGLSELGEIRRERGHKDCVAAYREALVLAESIGDRAVAATCAFYYGTAYQVIPELRDLKQAEHWYLRSLELTDERDRLGRGQVLAQLGSGAFASFKDAREQKRPEAEIVRHLCEAIRFYYQALEHFPSDAVEMLATIHNALGAMHGEAGDRDRAVAHFRDAIRYEEKQGDIYGASGARFNVARTLANAGRPVDALEYAQSALRGFETYGESATDVIKRTRQLIAGIEKLL